ncbi:hypothetical protein HMPREF9333_01848 [Johnsonella ignava ATCC 51276]|uniref:HTH cro/C1-type domain-containing protein n=1 Tax=Johnsonella ignava ATCC 51276 TaxID=679200 RepID=G5GJV8_9FIRM|nr:helix-turn-helix transcriptional regulator [Johnsonella ignava]EHI55001.1 hypothetical protein HMPREF9333_01848 [Johnsonella ignava ATCC 51276]
MGFTYSKLWKKLIDEGMSKTDLREKIKISPSTLAKMSKNQYVSMEILEKICIEFNCDISEILEFKNNENI